MPKTIDIRNVPDDVHQKLEARAACAGVSLSDYLLTELRKLADRPSLSEMRQRLAERPPVQTDIPSAQAVREERDRR